MVTGIVIAGVLGVFWSWIVWIVIGGIAGAIADRIVQGDQLGILGNIIVGIIGGVIGGVILGAVGVNTSGILWTFLTALGGAIVLLLIVKAITHGRGVGGKRRTTV